MDEDVRRVLKTACMDINTTNKFKNYSYGMKKRIGLAMALLGNPGILILDEPFYGLDMVEKHLMREVITDIAKTMKCTVIITTNILDELENIATRYGILRNGKMIYELSSKQFDDICPVYVSLKAANMNYASMLTRSKYKSVMEKDGYLRVYDSDVKPEVVAKFLYEKNVMVNDLFSSKISLEEFYNKISGEET
ncbi:MAG: ATP-binding cassette domain-containing protein [Butyrivibrio sp.]|nr:ATP-binding cassette domain-containing protein [Butyrivibrio sp.]